MKIAHYLASCGACSRRQGEKLVLDGKVRVNEIMLDNVAYRVDEADVVSLNGKRLRVIENAKLYSYYKPVQTLVTHAKECDKTNIFELVEPRIGNVFSVGRLDYMSEGLILLTNSNKLCSELMHSSLLRTYKLLISDDWNNDMENFVSENFTIDNIDYRPWRVLRYYNGWLTIQLSEGKNREIRKVCNYMGIIIKRLIRIAYGPYKIIGKPGDINLFDSYKI